MAKSVFKSTAKKQPMAGYTVELEAGETVFREGDLGTEMYILHEGKVEILKELDGEEQQLAVLEKGDFFGEMSLLEDLPRTATARSLEGCKLIRINGATFDQMLRSKPEIAVRIMRKLSRRLRQTDQLLEEALGSAAPAAGGDVPAMEMAAETVPSTQSLIHPASGTEFPLSASSETTVGRRDPVTGIHPDIDLTPVDIDRSTSRRHAKILRRDDKLFVNEEIGTMNGTFINGARVETGVPTELRPGDEVQFGLVKLTFRGD
jgi:CRP-like cAMP-binding protein